MKRIGIIAGLIISVAMFFLIGRDENDLLFRITLSITFGWIGFNGCTYSGRYRPKIVYALKICYPLFIWFFLMGAFGKI